MSVKHIGNHAFYEKGLTSIVIPDGIKSIGVSAFAGYPYYEGEDGEFHLKLDVTLNELGAVTIPDSVESVDEWAFAYSGLTSITLSSNITSIGNGVFSDNDLTSVVIPEGVESIGEWAFIGNGLTSVVIPNLVTSIGEFAFAENRLSSVTLPASVTMIDEYAFFSNGPNGNSGTISVNTGESYEGTWEVNGNKWIKN